MAHGLVLGLKHKPEFLPLFNLGEPVTTGDAVGYGAELNCIWNTDWRCWRRSLWTLATSNRWGWIFDSPTP